MCVLVLAVVPVHSGQSGHFVMKVVSVQLHNGVLKFTKSFLLMPYLLISGTT